MEGQRIPNGINGADNTGAKAAGSGQHNVDFRQRLRAWSNCIAGLRGSSIPSVEHRLPAR
jgi:hypothetical protein